MSKLRLHISIFIIVSCCGCKQSTTQPTAIDNDPPTALEFQISVSPTEIASSTYDAYQLVLTYSSGYTDFDVFESVDHDSAAHLEYKFSSDSLLYTGLAPMKGPNRSIVLRARKLPWGEWARHCTFWVEYYRRRPNGDSIVLSTRKIDYTIRPALFAPSPRPILTRPDHTVFELQLDQIGGRIWISWRDSIPVQGNTFRQYRGRLAPDSAFSSTMVGYSLATGYNTASRLIGYWIDSLSARCMIIDSLGPTSYDTAICSITRIDSSFSGGASPHK
jgi:hypothetical protein